MSRESRRLTVVLSLLTLVIVSLCLVLLLPAEEGVSAADLQRCLDSLGEEPGDRADMRDRAGQLGALLFGDHDDRDKFAEEVTELYFDTRQVDFLLIYNTGGFGGGTMADDPEWPGVLDGINAELAALGYGSMIVEHQRGSGGLMGFLTEVDDLGCNYRRSAPELAAKLGFITKYNPALNVITTGRCFGAVISNEAIQLSAGNPRIHSVQAGRPFWYTDSGGERTLVVEDNGLMPDILSSDGVLSFLWTLAKANVGRIPSTSPPEEGSFRALSFYLSAPGHTYKWEHPGVRSRIVAFLEQNFG
jgi:hypothetical protein